MDHHHLRPIITLTTDFGLSDHYVGTMKGVILSRCPDAQIVDVCHQLAAFSILSGAYTIAQAAPYFPPGSLHVVVVDPGVGTSRKPILVEAVARYFIAPDNGVLSLILGQQSDPEVREITNSNLFLPALSSTFHGRDVFAAVAAAFAARQVTTQAVGPILRRPILLDGIEPVQTGASQWQAPILSVDHFGNIITGFKVERFPLEEGLTLRAANTLVTALRRTFGEAKPNEIFLYPGSSGYVEIGINQGSAARSLAMQPGDSLTLTCPSPP